MLAIALSACVCTSCGSGSSTSSSSVTSSTTPTCITGPVKPLAVPGVDGYPVPQADYDVRCAGLLLARPDYRPNTKVPNGFVITTSPAQGTPEQAGAAVTLIVSEGPYGCGTCNALVGSIELAYRVMPDVCGMTVQRADTFLATMGITLATPERRGIITGSVPAAGVRFLAYGDPKKAQAVVVTVSSSPPGSSTPAPSTSSACR